MMKYLTSLFFVLTFAETFGQTIYEPQILILAPNMIKYEEEFENEISNYNKEIKQKISAFEIEQFLNSPEFKKKPENLQIIARSGVEFFINLDFFKQISFIAEQSLFYRFYEKFPNTLLIKLKDTTSSGALIDLKTHSEKEKLQYVLNFAFIELYKENNSYFAKITIQLYDNVSNSILLDKTYIGDWRNHGFEFSCEDKTIHCTINNALSQIVGEVSHTIAANSPTLKRERQLKQERFDVLKNNYMNQPFDKQLVENIISPLDSNINLKIIYQVLVNPEKNKFVAFFLEQVSKQDFKTLSENQKDKNINIISSNGIKDEGFLDDIPKTYAYIVTGLKYEGKWYYEKSNSTYFESKTLNDGQQKFFNNLQQWNFFKENSTEFNPDFWEATLFKKVPDLRKDPRWEEYGESIWKIDEINNRPYIGLNEIVANNMRMELEKAKSEYDKLKSEQFAQFYTKLKSKDPKTYHEISEHSLIYPSDKSIIMNPALITNKDGEKSIHYFVMLGNQNSVFEWTYFEPIIITKKSYGSQIVEQISTLTDWSFMADNLNDKEFWDKYVLLKSGDTYKYLKKIK